MTLGASRRRKCFVVIDRSEQTEWTGTLAQLPTKNVSPQFKTDTLINWSIAGVPYTTVLQLAGSVVFHYKENTGCFTTSGLNCIRWLPRSLWWKKLIYTWVRFWTVTELWPFFNSSTRPRVNISQLAGSRTPLAYLDTFKECGEGGGVGIRLARAQFTTERQLVLRPAVAFSKTSFKHR